MSRPDRRNRAHFLQPRKTLAADAMLMVLLVQANPRARRWAGHDRGRSLVRRRRRPLRLAG